MPATLTEEVVQRLAPDDSTYQNGRDLVRKKAFANLGVSADGTWLLASCKGSGKDPYQVSADIADDAGILARCTCPSRKYPCKHGVGLMLAYVQVPNQFKPREPDPDLAAKREKSAARAAKKAEAGPAAPKKPNLAALAKKASAQRDGLDLLEKLLLDLVAAGQWTDKSRLDRLDRQAKQLNDAYLTGAAFTLQRLVHVGYDEGVGEDEKLIRGSELVGQLWATVQKGRAYLDGKIAGDESQSEADAVIEDVIGKVWQMTDLKEKGYFRPNLALLELAYERISDQPRQQQIETSHLLDLKDGAVHQAITYRPFKGMQYVAEQPSYAQPMTVTEAAVYPGFLNRRVRWDKGAEKAEDLKPAHLKTAYGLAAPDFEKPLAAYRQQLKHPLAPRDAVVWVRCEKIGTVGPKVVVEDAKGARLEATDRREDYSNVANLTRAAGMLGKDKPALLARLVVRPLTNTIAAEPLALLTPKHHLRLGI